MKRASSYDLAEVDMTNLMVWARVRSGLLLNGMEKSSERKMWYPYQLRALLLLRKDVSEFSTRTILLDQ